jgi:hypothetical protein
MSRLQKFTLPRPVTGPSFDGVCVIWMMTVDRRTGKSEFKLATAQYRNAKQMADPKFDHVSIQRSRRDALCSIVYA